QGLETIFGPRSRFPASACRAYEFRKPAEGVSGARRQAWNRALAGAAARLGDLARAFEELTRLDPDDAAAWFNLALCRPCLGDHPPALAALDRYLDLEVEEAPAVEAATLAEVLRFGYGMEEQCDYHEYSFTHQIRDAGPAQALLQEWLSQRRLIPLDTQQQGVPAGIVLEPTPTGPVTAGPPPPQPPHLAPHPL